MKSFKRIIFFILAIVALAITQSHSQVKAPKPDTIADRRWTFYPLVKDTTGLYPKYIEVVGGVIEEVTTGLSCGVNCGCGTVKIHLAKDILLYPKEYVYVAVACFNVNPKDYLNKKIDIKLFLLAKDNKDCFWNEAPMNQIDSKGVPFYIPEGDNWGIKVY